MLTEQSHITDIINKKYPDVLGNLYFEDSAFGGNIDRVCDIFNGIEYQKYFKIYAFYIVGTFLDVSWLFTGLEEMKPVVVRNYIVRIIFTIIIVCVYTQ